jgi:hypothetical protein
MTDANGIWPALCNRCLQQQCLCLGVIPACAFKQQRIGRIQQELNVNDWHRRDLASPLRLLPVAATAAPLHRPCMGVQIAMQLQGTAGAQVNDWRKQDLANPSLCLSMRQYSGALARQTAAETCEQRLEGNTMQGCHKKDTGEQCCHVHAC